MTFVMNDGGKRVMKIKRFAYLCCLLIAFANSLDPDQARHCVRPDLDPNCSTLHGISGKVDFEKIQQTYKKACRITH